MCPKSLEKAFAFHCPKAVIVTDIYGQSANYSLIAKICKKNNVPIIEDAAESLGATYKNKKCGSFGDLSILSFNGNKIITTSGGGMLLSNDENLIKKAKKLSNQAKEDTIYYQHNEIGYNYRLSNVLAALGRAQFNSLDNFVRKKRKIFKNYKSLFCKQKFIQFMPEIEKGVSTNWLSVILVNRQKIDIMKIIAEIIDNNIEVRPLWKPMHMQPIFKNNLYYKFETSSVSKTLFYHGICLPSGLSLKLDNQIEISNIILTAIEKN